MKRNILFLFSFILLLAVNMNAQVIENSFIIINAESRVEIPAKLITFSITLEQADTNAQNAYQNIKELEKKFLALMKKFNISDTSISYSLTQFRKSSGYNNRPMKYRAYENIVVKLFDFKQYEPFQLALLSAGIYSFHGNFSTTNISEIRQIGVQKALNEAKEQAKIISNKIGRKLGKVLEVESNNRNYVVSPTSHGQYFTVSRPKLIDIPQHVTLYTRIKVKYELK